MRIESDRVIRIKTNKNKTKHHRATASVAPTIILLLLLTLLKILINWRVMAGCLARHLLNTVEKCTFS